MPESIPKARFAIIGGSSTYSIDFPKALSYKDVDILQKDVVFKTPYGESPPFTLFSLGGKRTLTCKMHGWRSGASRADASKQIFWVFREAGVRKIIVEGGVGAVNHLLSPRDIVVPTDYIDHSMRKDVNLGSNYLLIMRKAICEDLHEIIVKAVRSNLYSQIGYTTSSDSDSLMVGINPQRKPQIFERGVYAVTDGRHFESPAEVSVLKQSGVDIVGQSMCPEVYLAREIGACYAGVYLVVNYAEGIVEDWRHEELSEIFYSEAELMGRILLDSLSGISDDDICECGNLRKQTLLKEDSSQ
jgi:5'-methylthioadenosine phosphorylase